MPALTIKHITTYRYKQPVGFGEHRMMLRPREPIGELRGTAQVALPQGGGDLLPVAAPDRAGEDRLAGTLEVSMRYVLCDTAPALSALAVRTLTTFCRSQARE
jgi:hypothetical protein